MALATVRDRYGDEEIVRYYEQGLWQDQTLFDAVRDQYAQQPDKVFGTDSTTSITYRELHDRALALALGLVRRGVTQGDRVAVQIPSWTEFFVISAALARIGAVIVPIMPIYRRDEVGYILAAAGVKVAFTTDTYRGFDHAQMFLDLRVGTDLREVIVVRGETVPSGATSFGDIPVALEDGDGPSAAEQEIGSGAGPDDSFVIVFSSGTTSRPKGCLHTFNTMACGARLLGKGWAYTSDDVQFGPSPVTHTTGLVTSFILPLIHGAASHLMEQWEPREGLERIAKFGCTGCVSATTFLQMVLNVYDPAVHDASTMRFWTSAGAPIPASFVRNARAAFPDMQVLSLYGRTENITTTMCTLEDDPERSVTSDGSALPLQEVRIVDLDGLEVPRGGEGDIAYRGAMNCLEYIGQPQETAANYTADGFHRSGDLGTMDEDGYVRVTGRLKDIVIRGGLNISVRQVEDLLTAHKAVGEIAVVGMPDERMGEKVCAYLVPSSGHAALTLDEVRDYLLGEGLAIQKVPERLEVVESLPTTATGKIQKHVLRADIARKLAGSEPAEVTV
ncbi:cyclohexanecarboxylate-CoA ligase [Nocardioides sp. BE266]|uniref:AMP-binding protein n=1 Tax=Nocardioides sp. BE266 TaxID=2817725 RepID=UPI002858A274|nr:AMP-binding protein [Nocardioides sp. BE266]MDR7254243.1 cyclohexanecarboxylate-CoA ligase [Nocardioides sp. BE266]